MTITVRPPLVFLPHPRPKWWGVNPDTYEVEVVLPTASPTLPPLFIQESGVPPRKLPPPIQFRMVGPQRPFKFYPLEIFPKKVWADTSLVNGTAALPTAATQPLNFFDGVPPPKKLPPYIAANTRSQATPAALGATNTYQGMPAPRKLPPPIPVRANSNTGFILPTNLAQLQPEFDPSAGPKKYWPTEAVAPNFVLLTTVVLPPPPRGPDYPSKWRIQWTEDAALPNVAAQPLLIGLAQALDDNHPTGLPKKKWFQDPPFPNVATQPLTVTATPIVDYDYPAKKPQYWPEDAAAPNVPILPIPSASQVVPRAYFNYWKNRGNWPEDAAPQDFWALPSLDISHAEYDWPAQPAKRWPGDPFPFTNWVQEAPPLPLNIIPQPYERPKPLFVLDNWMPQPGLAPSFVPIYQPVLGYEIFIAYRTFTVATPVRTLTVTLPTRVFTVSISPLSTGQTVQTFDVKDPAESWPLTFNMQPDLFSGETLNGVPTVTVQLASGADPNPTAIINGTAGFDQTQTQVIQPVTGGISGCQYRIIVTCGTTNPLKILTLVGILPVLR